MKKAAYQIFFICFILLVADNFSVGAENVDIHGFISQGYLKTNQNNYLAKTDDGSFQFNEMGINFTTFVSSDLKVGCQFFARDLGNVGNDEITVNWAFAEYSSRDWLGLRVGIMKHTMGFYNEIRDYDSLRTWIILPPSVYDEWLRDGLNSFKGFEIFGTLNCGPLGILKYTFHTAIGIIPPNSGTETFLTEIGPRRLESVSSIDNGNSYFAKLIWKTPLDGFRIGASCQRGSAQYEGEAYGTSVSIDVEETNLIIFSAEYIYRKLIIAAENYWNLTDIHTNVFLNGALVTSIDSNVDVRDVFYVNIGYQFTDWFEASYYYSRSKGTDESLGIFNNLKDHCISLRFNINYNWITKLETHIMDGKYGVWPDDDGHTYSEWFLFAVKVSYSF